MSLARMNHVVLLALTLFAWAAPSQSAAAAGRDDATQAILWEIGKADQNNAEFALAPRGYAQFQDDAFFVIGSSESKTDWPYVHPGPADGWAGARPHTFIVLFGLSGAPATDECRLQVDLIDTQGASPPKLRVEVNGRAFERSLPAGAGDASVFGQPDRGREHKFTITFPASLLRTGDNEVRITTLSGSWMLYDWIGLTVPAGAVLADVQSRTLLDEVISVRAARAGGPDAAAYPGDLAALW